MSQYNYITQLPQGNQYFLDGNKKHYGGFNYSEI